MCEMITDIERDATTGRFKPGNNGDPGRKRGSRHRHSESFLAAFAADFESNGAAVIEKVRTERPEIYLKIAADLLPKTAELDVDVNIFAQVGDVLEAFRVASDLLGTDPSVGMRRLRRLAPRGGFDAVKR